MNNNADSAAESALAYIAHAERLCLSSPADAGRRRIARVGVIGLGTMGVGISTALLCAGIPVVAIETSQSAADSGMSSVQKNIQRLAERGKIDAGRVDELAGRLLISLDRAALSNCDMVIEAAFEDFQLKKSIASVAGPAPQIRCHHCDQHLDP